MYKAIYAYNKDDFAKELDAAEKEGFSLKAYSTVATDSVLYGDFIFTALMHKADEPQVERIKAMREAQKSRMNHMQKLADKADEIIHNEAMKFYEEEKP